MKYFMRLLLGFGLGGSLTTLCVLSFEQLNFFSGWLMVGCMLSVLISSLYYSMRDEL